jgi:hypothetical protein
MEGVKAKQSHDALHLEVCSLQRNLQHASALMDLCNQKIIRLEDQVGGTFILNSYTILAGDLNIENYEFLAKRLVRAVEETVRGWNAAVYFIGQFSKKAGWYAWRSSKAQAVNGCSTSEGWE